jgi:hypothetical protein
MKPTNEPENQRVVKEKGKAIGTAAHEIEGPKTTGGLGPRTAPVDPTKPIVSNPNEQPKGKA